jgi:hypothetical protein
VAEERAPGFRLVGIDSRKSAAIFFLNCTENTELTRAHFARTVTFALIKFLHSFRPPSGSGSHSTILKQQHQLSGRRYMKLEEWKTYRTRFLVNAKQLSSSLSFVDHLGRQHRGRKGDYLVESSDGVISITPRRIFEDIYVLMPLSHQPGTGQSPETMIGKTMIDETRIEVPRFIEASIDRKFEALEIEEVKLRKAPIGRRQVDDTARHRPDILRNDETSAVRRKLPQPCRERRGSAEHLRLM